MTRLNEARTRFREVSADPCKASTLVGLPPPLRGRVGERGGHESPCSHWDSESPSALLISPQLEDWSTMCP
jgi:hypothetical protein